MQVEEIFSWGEKRKKNRRISLLDGNNNDSNANNCNNNNNNNSNNTNTNNRLLYSLISINVQKRLTVSVVK